MKATPPLIPQSNMPSQPPENLAPWPLSQRFINRELSWLAFNQRVLAEAGNESHPLLERLRFLAISASNLDEFITVRVAGLKAQARAKLQNRSDNGQTPEEQLQDVHRATLELIEQQQALWQKLRPLLDASGIHLLSAENLSASEQDWCEAHFNEALYSILTPIAVDPAHPFPFIPSGGLTLVLRLQNPKDKTSLTALVPIPHRLGRFVRLPDRRHSKSGRIEARFLPIEQMITLNLATLFPNFTLEHSGLFRILRDSELEIEEEAEDLMRTFETALKRRRRGNVIWLSASKGMAENLIHFLQQQLKISSEDTVLKDGLNGLVDVRELIVPERKDLLFERFTPRFPERIRDEDNDCFAAIRNKDILVHHPFESFDVVVQFLRQAAEDPKVIAIKQTLYRTSQNSPIVEALMRAAENGKAVTAMVELRARFDEEANIQWARTLERAGAQVIYGFVDIKTHAKMSLVVRQEGKHARSYVHYGTGNYHPQTATIYTDLSYFTCDPALCQDAARLFNYMTGYAEPEVLEKIAIAPLTLRETLYQRIEQEIQNAKQGKPAQIWGKMNALVDPEIIERLYAASAAGVQIDLIIRGICCLRPGVSGLSENIRVRSLVGRFLEHARAFAFANGHALPSTQAQVYISSADWMPRNLDWRIETLVPIENPTVHQQILHQILVANLKDNQQAWELLPCGTYQRIVDTAPAFCAHHYFMQNPSLSGRGRAAKSLSPPQLEPPARRRKHPESS